MISAQVHQFTCICIMWNSIFCSSIKQTNVWMCHSQSVVRVFTCRQIFSCLTTNTYVNVGYPYTGHVYTVTNQ